MAKGRLLADPNLLERWYSPDEIGIIFSTLRDRESIPQMELADFIETKQSSISRFERSKHLPSLEWLKRAVSALGYNIEIRFIKKHDKERTEKRDRKGIRRLR